MQRRVIVEGLGGGNPQSTMVSRALISLCHEIRLAPARGDTHSHAHDTPQSEHKTARRQRSAKLR